MIASFEAVIDLLEGLDLSVAYSSINKAGLHIRYDGAADNNAYLLALQFLLKMVADMQEWRGGEVPGRRLTSVIDSLHYVVKRELWGSDRQTSLRTSFNGPSEMTRSIQMLRRLSCGCYTRSTLEEQRGVSPGPNL